MLKGKVVACALMVIALFIPQHLESSAQTTGSSDGNWIVPGSSPQPGQPATAVAPAPAAVPAPQPAGPVAGGKGMTAMQRTSANKQYCFIFFNNGQNEQTDAMWAIFYSTLSKLAGRAEGVPVNISDPLEQEIVHRFDVSRAPMPLVLVLAPNGAIMGGFPTKFDETQLMGVFGTPALEETMKFLQERRLVFLCIQNQSTQQNDAAMYGVNELRADPQMGGAVRVVMVNPADTNETKLLSQLQVDPSLNVAQTVMLAPPGSPVGKFMGGTTKNMLLSKLQASGGCGPGGCAGGKCGPAAAGPQAAAPPQEQSAMKKFFSKVTGR